MRNFILLFIFLFTNHTMLLARNEQDLTNLLAPATPRLILIPGFGEDISIYEKLAPYLPNEKILVDNWETLKEIQNKKLTADNYARLLIQKYAISKNDIVIGHSMGGWVGVAIKQITGCKLIQLSSWTDKKKISPIPVFRPLVYGSARSGILFNKGIKKYIIHKYYKKETSKDLFAEVYDRLKYGDKKLVVKQLKLIFAPLPNKVSVTPDLRIHARNDHVISFPDEPFAETPGDHFSLYTYPEAVGKLINAFIKGQKD